MHPENAHFLASGRKHAIRVGISFFIKRAVVTVTSRQ